MGLFDFLTGGSRREKFARQVMEGLRRGGAPFELGYDKAEFAILFDAGGRFGLQNAFRSWEQAPPSQRDAELEKVIQFGLEVMTPPDNTWETVAPLILPAVRNRSHMTNEWVGYADLEPRNSYAGAVRTLGDSYQIAIVIDRQASVQVATTDVFKNWGKPFDEVERIALDNLRARSACRFTRAEGGFFISDYGDFHDSARLLLPHLFEALHLTGDPVVIPLSRNCLLVAGADDPAALEAMAHYHEAAFQADARPTGIEALLLRDGRWQTAGNEVSPVLGRLRFEQRSWDYAEQKGALEAYFKKVSRDAFVPGRMVFELETTGELLSWASWTQGVPSLLPEADLIGLTSDDLSETLTRSWDDVVDICGPGEPEACLFPPRWFRETGPTAEQWEQLRARADPTSR